MNIHTLAVASLVTTCSFLTHGADESLLSTNAQPFLPWDKASISLGGFVATFDDSLGFGVNGSVGVAINPEKTLGLDSSLVVFRIEALYRPGKSLRNQLDFSYAGYHRSGSGTLSQEITINGNVYPVGAEVNSHLNFDVVRGTYSYAILQDERVRIALGLTVYAVPLSYGVDIRTAAGLSSINGADTTLPLPAVALRGEFLLVPKLFLNASVDAMYLEIGDFRGSIVDFNIGLEYMLWKHFGIGLNYNVMSVHVEAESTHSNYPGANFVGAVDVHYDGLMLYGKFSF